MRRVREANHLRTGNFVSGVAVFAAMAGDGEDDSGTEEPKDADGCEAAPQHFPVQKP